MNGSDTLPFGDCGWTAIGLSSSSCTTLSASTPIRSSWRLHFTPSHPKSNLTAQTKPTAFSCGILTGLHTASSLGSVTFSSQHPKRRKFPSLTQSLSLIPWTTAQFQARRAGLDSECDDLWTHCALRCLDKTAQLRHTLSISHPNLGFDRWDNSNTIKLREAGWIAYKAASRLHSSICSVHPTA